MKGSCASLQVDFVKGFVVDEVGCILANSKVVLDCEFDELDWQFCILVLVQRFQKVEDTKADIISLLADEGNGMLESYGDVLKVSFDLQDFRVLHLDCSILILKLVEILVLIAVKAVVLSHPDNLEFLR